MSALEACQRLAEQLGVVDLEQADVAGQRAAGVPAQQVGDARVRGRAQVERMRLPSSRKMPCRFIRRASGFVAWAIPVCSVIRPFWMRS